MKEAAQTGAPIEHVCEMYHIDWVYAGSSHTEKAAMKTDRCIHGFEEQHCASCRRCQHGLFESRCATCRPKTAREATIMLANDAARPAEEHRGYEISYGAGQRSWYIRADADAPLSQTHVSLGLPGAASHRRDPRPPDPRRRRWQEEEGLTTTLR